MVMGIHGANGFSSCPYCVLKKDCWLHCASDPEYSIEDDLRDPQNLQKRKGMDACRANTGSSCVSVSHGVLRSSLLENLVHHRNIYINELNVFLRIWDCVFEYLIAFVEVWEIER